MLSRHERGSRGGGKYISLRNYIKCVARGGEKKSDKQDNPGENTVVKEGEISVYLT